MHSIFKHLTLDKSESGNSNRGRKKTISLDQQNQHQMAQLFSSYQSGQTPPNIPSGLTIERKRAGKNDDHRTASPVVDKVEITKVPVTSSNGVTSSHRDFSPFGQKNSGSSNADAPLNLSLKTSNDMYQSKSDASKIPSEYYACKSLNLLSFLFWKFPSLVFVLQLVVSMMRRLHEPPTVRCVLSNDLVA